MTFPTTLTNPAQANAPTVVNANLDALKAVAVFAKQAATTSGLTWGYYGGTILVDGVLTSIADGTVALTASATNYVEATRAGVVSANTTGFTAGRAPLYTLVCGASTVTTETDSRAWVQPDYIAGRVSVAVTTADVTLSAAQARCNIINATGALTGNRNIIVPDGPATWCVTNNTTGAYTLTVKTAAGTGIAISQGKAVDLLADGTNVLLSNNDAAAAGGSLLAANNLSDVANAATARTNLGVDTAISAAIAGLNWKQAVRAATTAAGTLASSFANASVIDGVTLATGDRILIKNQAAGAENGIYVVAASGAPTRATDADSGAELVNASVHVSEGTTLADTQWTCTTNATITVGTTSLAFAQFTASGALVYITETLNTASPNAANNVVSLAVTGGSAINSLALIPKGTAGLLAAVPDGTGAGGNARGLRSVDWQMARSTAAQVAAGDESVIGGGNGNEIGSTSNNAVIAGGNSNAIRTVAAPYATIGGGSDNVISGGSDYAVIAGGSSNTISSSALRNTIGGGGSNTISGSGSINTIGGGSQNTISGTGATIPGGELNTATGNYSQAGGQYAHDRGVRGAVVHAGGRFAADGDAQREQYVLFRQTTNATPTALTAGGAAASASNQPALAASGGAMAFTGRVVARDSSDTAGFQIQGTIRNLSGTVALVGTPTVTALGASAGASTWAVTVAADNTNKCLQILGTGEAAKTIKWVCSIESVYAL